VQIASAIIGSMDLIVTRNVSDYQQSPIPAVEPPDAVSRLMP
jgi:hypothetical protein